MSNDLRTYKGIFRKDLSSIDMNVTATMQGNYGKAIQFTIGATYCVLAENQLKDLIKIIQKRIRCVKGYSATDWGKDIIVEAKIKELVK